MEIISNNTDGTIKLHQKFDINKQDYEIDATPTFSNIGSDFIVSFIKLKNISKFTKFRHVLLNVNEYRYIKNYYRISRNGNDWTEWLILNEDIINFPTVDTKDDLYIDIKWVREGSSTIGVIKLLEYELNGIIDRDENILFGDIINIQPNKSSIIRNPNVFKVFRVDDIEVIPAINVDIKYRYTQDSTRTWSEWEYLTKENIKAIRINPIRFFQIEYEVINNTDDIVQIQDINLIGDFQNVTKDYQKTNLYGIRECCSSNLVGYYNENGIFIPNSTLNTTNGVGDNCDSNTYKPMTDQQKADLYNPYNQSKATNLLEKLSADSEQMFGHLVTYFVTDPDSNGQDHTLNEYQLYNIVCQGDLKVAIDGNNFPDSQIKMNIFDLDLFETMEAHVTKQQFKQLFGVQRRPSKEDFLYFCQTNRMYQVDHAQQFRSFNNNAVYYKLILKKYNKKANVITDIPEIKNQLDTLTNNTTIDQLFGFEQKQDKDAIAKKVQHTPLSSDLIRLEYFAEIDKELIENSTTIISKSHYDLSTVNYKYTAVKYNNFKSALNKGDNLSFMMWFSINNYLNDEEYNFIKIYDDINNMGISIHLKNDSIHIKNNHINYDFIVGQYNQTMELNAFEEETWYCYILNINQRQRKMTQYIYKRNVEFENEASKLGNNLLKLVIEDEKDIDVFEYIIDENPQILGSDMKMTNIRLFSEILPKETHNKIANQYIIGDDSKYLIFADNATTRLYLNKYPYNTI